jgi:hypothetical protein
MLGPHNADFNTTQRKAARRAKRKGDPYYLDDKANDDVDSIPIVKLDLELPNGEPVLTVLSVASWYRV